MTGEERWALLQKKPPKLKAEPKRIATKGKRQLEYEQWRDETAIPYLDQTYGHVCFEPGCTKTTGLDVDHIKSRGSHPELKMNVDNVVYRCRRHHIEKDGGMRAAS